MSYQLITQKFNTHLVEQFIESISEPANNVYYITASKHTPYPNNVVTIPYDTVEMTVSNYYEQLIFGKKINSTDVAYMAPRVDWSTNTVYSMYTDTDTELYTKNFYTVSNQGSVYYVYKVLDNNNGAASTVDPGATSTSESACNFVTTSDGYTWKLMYKMAQEDFEKFATLDYMPVVQSANVAGNTVAGAIDVITISSPGSDYVATIEGSFTPVDLRDAITGGNNTTYKLSSSASANNDFYIGSGIYLTGGTGQGQLRKIVSYAAATRVITIDTAFDISPESDTSYLIAPYVTVVGDGTTNTTGYAVIASGNGVNNYISSVVISNRGAGYTYAQAIITGNNAIGNTATLNVVVPPVGGHGSDAINELGARYLGISTTFANNESGFITTENDYRQIGILKDPLFNNVNITMGDDTGTFVAGEAVHQVDYKIITGTIQSNSANTTITGSDTDFINSVKSGDKIILIDTINNIRSLRTVSSVANATSLELTSNSAFNMDVGGKLALCTILCSGVDAGNSSPYISLDSAQPKFVIGKRIIGEQSGAWANVTSISVSEKLYNSWNTFDNRTRISYSSVSGDFTEDDALFQGDPFLANAYFHSANTTHVFLTSERGPVNPDPTSTLDNYSGASFTLGTIKYEPDIKKGSGKLIYIENTDPISRSNSQSETIRLVLKF